MIKVVLDANQFVSALLKQASNSSRLLDLVHAGDVRLLVSEKIITEIDRVIRYPKVKKIHRRSDSNLDAFIIKIIRAAQMVSGTLKLWVSWRIRRMINTWSARSKARPILLFLETSI